MAGLDVLRGGDGNDLALGGAGNDRLLGEIGNDTLLGDEGLDVLFGGDGSDMLHGGSERDVLRGEAGPDTIIGGTGGDILSGGAGANLFRYESWNDAFGGERISDFSQAEGDRIDLSALDGDAVTLGHQPLVFLAAGGFVGSGIGSVLVRQTAADTVVLVDQGDGGQAEIVFRLSGVLALTAQDFIL